MAMAAALAALFVVARLPQPAPSPAQMVIALAVTSIFALLAAIAHGVNISGALAGLAIAFILAARELRMFAVLLLVFALTLAATRVGAERKRLLRRAESSAGRSASQVMANLGVAAVIVTLAPADWKALALAALAEAAADTCSSEIGLAFPGTTVLITTWRAVSPGIDGGITWHGTAAALIAAGLVGLAGRVFGLVPMHLAMAVVYAGFLGALADSLFGALLERRGYLSNDLVNLLSTAVAAGIAWVMS